MYLQKCMYGTFFLSSFWHLSRYLKQTIYFHFAFKLNSNPYISLKYSTIGLRIVSTKPCSTVRIKRRITSLFYTILSHTQYVINATGLRMCVLYLYVYEVCLCFVQCATCRDETECIYECNMLEKKGSLPLITHSVSVLLRPNIENRNRSETRN